MSPDPVTISNDSTVEKAAQIVRARKFNALPVISKSGKLVGILTITDIIDGLLKLLNFQAEPLRVTVKIPEGVSLSDVVKVFQVSSEKVLSFSSPKGRKGTFYFWVIDCDFDKLNRNIKRRKLGVTINHPATIPQDLK
jgi:acetoin utilization protein AcuB